MNSVTPSYWVSASTPAEADGGRPRGGTANSCSPETRSGARLVTMAFEPGLARKISPTAGAPPTTCSKLSRTSRTWRSFRWSRSRSRAGRLLESWTPSVAAIVDGTRAGSLIGSSGTKNTPSRNWSATSAATCSDNRVLPVPPGPVRVRRRLAARSRPASATSRRRPMKLVSWVGRLLRTASSERSASNSDGRPWITSCQMRSGRDRSLRRCSPRSRRDRSSRSEFSTSARVVSETRTWPPWPADRSRATRWRSRPT